MISKDQLEKWTHMARRDDWHLAFVGSDIRQMLGEIERLHKTLQVIVNTDSYERDGVDQTAELMRRIARGQHPTVGGAAQAEGASHFTQKGAEQ